MTFNNRQLSTANAIHISTRMCVIDAKEAMRHGLARSHPLANASVKNVAGAIADDIFRRMKLTDETHPSYTIPALSDAGFVDEAVTYTVALDASIPKINSSTIQPNTS